MVSQNQVELVGRGQRVLKLPVASAAASSEELEELFATALAVIIHQIPSAGALTKIPELLNAGVPVIVNENAARTYFNLPGVNVYQELGELPELLMKATCE